MREIKFKAWSNVKNKMFSVEEMAEDQLTLLPTGKFINVSGASTKLSHIFSHDEMIPLQYTGLQDSDSTEEYFGYIIKEDDGTRRVIEDGCSAVLFKNTKDSSDIKYFWQLKPHWVIGSIYENPELFDMKEAT